MKQVVQLLLNVRVHPDRLDPRAPQRALRALPLRRIPALLDPLKARRPNPALVLANANVRPLANSLADGHFGALVNGEEVRT